ncbi:hypothetical protein V6N13_140520 [Hibiscus sabdariffa]|uniref:RING-type E3 ubiquitin transferase n=1 Tax=Hibiscus sabdariffa TaxID=183260 RepID=A0ABR2Q2P6_9ROSI
MYQSPARPLPYDADTRYYHLQREGLVSRCEKGSSHSEEESKPVRAKSQDGIGYTYWSAEEEDVCPTCLEEYTPENPKIITECSHHYHLGCSYEWTERSENCPVCGKLSFALLRFSSP